MNQKYLPYVQLHVAVFLFGFTAILGKLISLEGVVLVWYRIAITIGSLLLIPKVYEKALAIPKQDRRRLALIGCLVALHWATFYAAIKASNVSITLCCFASVPVFTALIEPLFFKRKILLSEMILGFFIVVGFVFIFESSWEYWKGMVIALTSSLLAATFSVMNKGIVDKYETFPIMLIEFLYGLGLLSLLIPAFLYFYPETLLFPTIADAGYLLILAIVCTTGGYTLAMYALKKLSAFTVNLAINLEPVYGILFAYFGLDEAKDLSPRFYIGAVIVIFAIFAHPFLAKKLEKKE
ncbi:MAG: DMT family transporter [Bacteroidales bacterium]